MKGPKFDIKAIPEKKSSRHHYIPQFFLRGFTNSKGLLYIYDKEEDRILQSPRPPKSIFFEKDRNTIRFSELFESSMIEDNLYSIIDTESSEVVKYFREEELAEIDFNTENTAQLQFFLITLFWRIPKTDFTAEDVIDRSEIVSQYLDPEIIRNDPAFRKFQRASLAKHHIEEIVKYGKKGKLSVNIHQSPYDIFVVGDNPLLFRKRPTLFSEFNEIDSLIALSSNRIYSSTNNLFNAKSQENWINYNAAIIDQSTKYIAAGSDYYLKKSVEYYKELKEHQLYHDLPERVFKT